MIKQLFTAALVATGIVGTASANTFEFTYTSGSTNQVLTGFFVADLNANDLLEVTEAFDVELDGMATPSIVRVTQFTDTTSTFGLLSTDASFIDSLACFDADCTEGFAFHNDDAVNADFFGFQMGATDIADIPINTGSFSLIPTNVQPPSVVTPPPMPTPGVPAPTPVPLPAAGILLLAALGGLGLFRRRAA